MINLVDNRGLNLETFLLKLESFDQPYAAAKAREYLDKPAIHETMVKVCSS